MTLAMTTAGPDRGAEPLDTTVRLVTPERVAFLYPLAGPFRRAYAYLLDGLVRLGLMGVAAVGASALALGRPSGTGLWLVALFVLEWGYPALFEATCRGQTPGKWATGLRVVAESGAPITAGQAVLRNLLRAVDGVPLAFLVGLASMLLTRKFQRLGDLAAGAMVVVEAPRRRSGVVRVEDEAVRALVARLPERIAVGSELARVLSEYVARRRDFPFARREEMAGPLARPLRARYGLPEDAPADAVLCAAYHRVFLGE